MPRTAYSKRSRQPSGNIGRCNDPSNQPTLAPAKCLTLTPTDGLDGIDLEFDQQMLFPVWDGVTDQFVAFPITEWHLGGWHRRWYRVDGIEGNVMHCRAIGDALHWESPYFIAAIDGKLDPLEDGVEDTTGAEITTPLGGSFETFHDETPEP